VGLFNRDEVKPRRSWQRKLLIAFNCALAVVIVAGVTVGGYTKWRFDQITKISLGDVLRGNEDAGGEMNVLMVGSDTREALDAADKNQFGKASQVGGQRSDTIMILHVNPKETQASILSIPRDTYVTIAGTHGKGKINGAYDEGPKQLIQTIEQNFDIPIDHYAEVNFDSFRSVVNALGGVEIPFSAPARDWGLNDATGRYANLSGLDVRSAGCINLNGDQALAYVRSRHYQALENGKWQSDGRGDITRIARQQDFIRRVMREAVDKASGNPLTLNSLVAAGVNGLKTDDNFGLGDMTKLARRFQSLDPAKVQMMTLKTTGDMVGGASVQVYNQAEMKATVDEFLGKNNKSGSDDKTPAAIPTGSISVRVLNGSGVDGQATDAATNLVDAGFLVTSTGNAAKTSKTVIRYNPADKAKADTLATFVKGGAQLVSDATVKGMDAILITGSDFQGITATAGAAPVSTSSTTPTTTAPANTTTSTTASPFVPDASISC
jgi:polyisoprenyl-teichoic acid--peptidoglycan teichoic acid transferase